MPVRPITPYHSLSGSKSWRTPATASKKITDIAAVKRLQFGLLDLVVGQRKFAFGFQPQLVEVAADPGLGIPVEALLVIVGVAVLRLLDQHLMKNHRIVLVLAEGGPSAEQHQAGGGAGCRFPDHRLLRHAAELGAPGICEMGLDDEARHHARRHVIEQVAVERPFADLVGGEHRGHGLAGRHDDHVLFRHAVGLAVFQLHEHAVQVHGMRHHGVVDEAKAHALSFFHADNVLVAEFP